MAVGVVRLAGEVVLGHDFAAHEALERQSRDHVQAKAQARNVDHDVVCREVVQHVAFGHVAKRKVAAEGHG